MRNFDLIEFFITNGGEDFQEFSKIPRFDSFIDNEECVFKCHRIDTNLGRDSLVFNLDTS